MSLEEILSYLTYLKIYKVFVDYMRFIKVKFLGNDTILGPKRKKLYQDERRRHNKSEK